MVRKLWAGVGAQTWALKLDWTMLSLWNPIWKFWFYKAAHNLINPHPDVEDKRKTEGEIWVGAIGVKLQLCHLIFFLFPRLPHPVPDNILLSHLSAIPLPSLATVASSWNTRLLTLYSPPNHGHSSILCCFLLPLSQVTFAEPPSTNFPTQFLNSPNL